MVFSRRKTTIPEDLHGCEGFTEDLSAALNGTGRIHGVSPFSVISRCQSERYAKLLSRHQSTEEGRDWNSERRILHVSRAKRGDFNAAKYK